MKVNWVFPYLWSMFFYVSLHRGFHFCLCSSFWAILKCHLCKKFVLVCTLSRHFIVDGILICSFLRTWFHKIDFLTAFMQRFLVEKIFIFVSLLEILREYSQAWFYFSWDFLFVSKSRLTVLSHPRNLVIYRELSFETMYMWK